MSNLAIRRSAKQWSNALLLLCAVFVSGCSRSVGEAGLKHVFDSTRRDLGRIRVESEYEAAYRITNSTSRPLVVSKIKTSCGCVVADFDPSPIAVGQSRNVTLNLSTHGQSVLGPLVKHATVFFESGEQVHLELISRLESDFEIEPRRLQFSADHPTRHVSLSRRLLDAETFARLVLVADPERYESAEDLDKRTPDQREFLVTLKDTPAAAALPDIYLADAPDGKALPLSKVVCTRSGPTLRPSAFVVVASGPDARTPAQRFELIGFKSQPLRITRVEPLDEQTREALEVSFQPESDPQSFSVTLAKAPDTPVARLHLAVDFESLDHSSTGRLLLPCHIVSSPGAGKPGS